MKSLKKILAVILAVIAVMSLGVFSASAESVNPPKFEIKLISQTDAKAELQLSLIGGEFNSVDIEIKTSSAITSISKFLTTDEFDKVIKQIKEDGAILESSSASTQKMSLASTTRLTAPIAMYNITVNKKTSADLVPGDITAVAAECVISTSSGEQKVASQVTFSYVFGKLDIAQESISMTYKSSSSLTLDSTFGKDAVKWSSSNTKVATVDENGKVYAAGKGNATITVETLDGSVKDTCKVTVNYAWWQWIIIIVLFGFLWY